VSNLTTRDAKLVQYLNEAYGKEKQLEIALEGHIAMTTRPPYKRRLQEHLKETKGHARAVERRIKQLGGIAEAVSVPGPEVISEAATRVQDVAHRGVALAQGPLHAVRGTGEQEKLLKNAKTEFSDEAEEIANYTAIETLANTVGDKETARLARDIRRQEERMSSFLERLIPQLTKAVAQAEIPAKERNRGTRRRKTSGRSSSSSRSSASATSRRGSTSRRGTTSRGTTSRRGPTSRRSTRRTARSRA
jgi:ferritin-like metal-binding protein YciE